MGDDHLGLDTIFSLAAEKLSAYLHTFELPGCKKKRVQVNIILQSLSVTEMVLRSPFTNSIW